MQSFMNILCIFSESLDGLNYHGVGDRETTFELMSQTSGNESLNENKSNESLRKDYLTMVWLNVIVQRYVFVL